MACGLLAGLAILATGCAGVGSADPLLREPVAARDDVQSAPPPQWRSGEMTRAMAGETAPPVAAPPPGTGPVLFADPDAPPVLFSEDPETLRAEVASECRSASSMKPRDALGDLVTALYLSMVDPEEGTDALIQGECASVEEIVREMVTAGGQSALPGVIERARAASPPGARRKIETAAAIGLAREAELSGSGSGPTRLAREHAMAYFPTAGPVVRVDAAVRLETLYRRATPGFGIYTFVLVGPGVERLSPGDQARSRELFRLIEMYAGGKGDAPLPQQAHVFLIPVDAELEQFPLFNQVTATLSDRMRSELIKDLRDQGQGALAGRLETGSGPFLLSGIQPALVPEGQTSFRLLADLSGVGIEHLYDVVDAFDRQLSPEVAGRPESLTVIRDRLNDISQPGGGEAGVRQNWVFLIGGGGDPGASVSARSLVIGFAALLQNRQPGA